MRATIDGGGRVVVPKAIRERLRLEPGSEVELIEHQGWLEIAPSPTPLSIVEDDGALVARAERPMPALSQDVVRAAVEGTRR